ncbi:unnamed protein product [Cuscuta epithymum]|uniref:Homeobox domain-containing protein n=1 Tax=Cuscuta epithymum TaxID=186058 RepID=A0AAV0GIT6_9ASTE|nr:unnamed protein product [Cuscuta epithymum]CAH9147831.1 unnamed protein product [Cuscuta epithymum]
MTEFTSDMELGLSLGLGITANKDSQNDSAGADGDYDDDAEDYEFVSASSEEPHGSIDQRLVAFPSPIPLDFLPPAPAQYMSVGFQAAMPAMVTSAEDPPSPNCAASSFRALDFSIFKRKRNGSVPEVGGGGNQRNGPDAAVYGGAAEADRVSSRASDDEENCGNARKKLRLSKEQSAFLEESFKEHNTLNPKQKHVLAKQLNLRPRQVEVWFQNRRARTKLKQTEVDCENWKKCFETVKVENTKLHKEVQELRALKTPNPFQMQFPATTLTMCPSCKRVASGSTAPPLAAGSLPRPIASPCLSSEPRLFPFAAAAVAYNPGHRSAT